MYTLLQKILFLLPPEKAHHLSLGSLSILNKVGLLKLVKPKNKIEPVEVMGINFPNRIGLAAGLDKNGDYIQALSNLGFGFVEIGTVTPRPQAGNPQPRLFRLPQAKAIINRMGFNNQGVDYLLERVSEARDAGFEGIIGINIGKNFDTAVENATEDYLIGLRKAYSYASYIVVNISSPNTPGLRDLQYGKELRKLLAALKAEQTKLMSDYRVYKPIAIKVAPDLNEDEIKDIAEALLDNKMDGLIATNTTLSRDAVKGMEYGDEAGGLSGAPVRDVSTEVIRQFHTILKDRIPIIGVGGISTAKDAQDKIEAGASLVQVYSGLIYEGPRLVKKIAGSLR
ncbi:MAG TPA: quinone-dependent dihydroorotate dehydrogenase [Leucothrix mucor]|nr:quinone-dependent dihydroorotate dehydrogenase [Leucothrix mucor]